MCTLAYVLLANWLDSWDDEPFASCLGLCVFILFDVYFVSEILRALIIGD